jgi:hypothetical protein
MYQTLYIGTQRGGIWETKGQKPHPFFEGPAGEGLSVDTGSAPEHIKSDAAGMGGWYSNWRQPGHVSKRHATVLNMLKYKASRTILHRDAVRSIGTFRPWSRPGKRRRREGWASLLLAISRRCSGNKLIPHNNTLGTTAATAGGIDPAASKDGGLPPPA